MKTIWLHLLSAWRVLTRKNTVTFSFTADFKEVEVISTGEKALDDWADNVGQTMAARQP